MSLCCLEFGLCKQGQIQFPTSQAGPGTPLRLPLPTSLGLLSQPHLWTLGGLSPHGPCPAGASRCHPSDPEPVAFFLGVLEDWFHVFLLPPACYLPDPGLHSTHPIRPTRAFAILQVPGPSSLCQALHAESGTTQALPPAPHHRQVDLTWTLGAVRPPPHTHTHHPLHRWCWSLNA